MIPDLGHPWTLTMMLQKLVIHWQEILLLINLDSKGMSAVHVLLRSPLYRFTGC